MNHYSNWDLYIGMPEIRMFLLAIRFDFSVSNYAKYLMQFWLAEFGSSDKHMLGPRNRTSFWPTRTTVVGNGYAGRCMYVSAEFIAYRKVLAKTSSFGQQLAFGQLTWSEYFWTATNRRDFGRNRRNRRIGDRNGGFLHVIDIGPLRLINCIWLRLFQAIDSECSEFPHWSVSVSM